MATIRDVAKAAGVSVSTVSNILNNKISVSEELYQKVMRVMDELHYHPNMLATNLRKRQMFFIGIIASSLSGHYHQIIEGVCRVAEEEKCHPILKLATTRQEEIEAIEALQRMSISGAIIISSNLDEDLVKRYTRASFPVVFVDFYCINSEHNIVRFDNYSIVKELTGKLLSQHEKVGLITCNRFLGSEEDCTNGYIDAYEAAETEADNTPLLYESLFNKEQAFTGLFDFISENSVRLSSVIVSNDQIAKTVTEILGLLGKEEISVYSLSGDSWYHHRTDSVTYIKRNAIFCGIEATKLLFENVKDSITFDTRQITLPYHSDPQEVFDLPARKSKKKDVTLRLLLLRSNVSKAIEKLSPDFTLRTGIHLDIRTATQQEISRILQGNVLQEEDPYDIVMADMNWLQSLTRSGVFHPLNELMDLNRILPNYIHDVRNFIISETDGETFYALPILAGYQVLAYRGDLFEDALLKKKFYLKYGIQLVPPRNWNEFNLMAKFFTRSFNEESPVQYGTCLAGSKPEGIMSEFLPRQWSYKGSFFRNGKPNIKNVANLKAVRNLVESYQYSYPDCHDFLEEEQINEFKKGDVAMIISYNVHLQDAYGPHINQVSFSSPPGTQSLIGGWFFGINARSKHAEESAQFLKWELSDRISAHSSLLGQVSPFKNVFFDNELLTMYPWMNTINEQRIELRTKEWDPLPFNDSKSQESERLLEMILANQLWEAMTGKIPPDAALEQAAADFETAREI